MHGRRRRWPLPAVLAAVAGVVLLAGCDVGGWTVVGSTAVNGLSQGQGLATVRKPGGGSYLYYTGDTTPPPELVAQGWNHVGDPDSSRGIIFDPYQAANGNATQKMFLAILPSGQSYEYVHDDVPGEQMNNSFAAVTPDGRWLVSGEWDQMTRFLIFPTPILNRATSPTGGPLPLTGQVLLDQPVVDIQGCTFRSSTRLLCSSDDPVAENGIPRKALIQVDLAHALTGGDVRAHVSPIGPLPLVSTCPVTQVGSWPGDFEVEGLDYDRATGALRVVVLPPGICALNDAQTYLLRQQGRAPGIHPGGTQ